MTDACIIAERPLLEISASLVSTLRRARSAGKEDVRLRRIDVLGDDDFRSIYEAHARALWAYLFRVSRDAAAADDLLQEVFCRYLEAPVSPQDERGLRSYLYRIASNLAVDRGRRLQREALDPLSAEIGVADAPSALGQDLGRLFAELKPRERALLWLAYVEEMTHAEIARTLSLSRASVRVLLFRARRRLARILEREGLGEEALS